MRYQSKPSIIEAVQWTGDNFDEVQRFTSSARMSNGGVGPRFLLAGKDGAQDYVPVPPGHWIVRQPGDLTDHWPVDPDYFAKKYEPVEP